MASTCKSTPKEKAHTEDSMCALSNPHLSLPPDLAPHYFRRLPGFIGPFPPPLLIRLYAISLYIILIFLQKSRLFSLFVQIYQVDFFCKCVTIEVTKKGVDLFEKITHPLWAFLFQASSKRHPQSDALYRVGQCPCLHSQHDQRGLCAVWHPLL